MTKPNKKEAERIARAQKRGMRPMAGDTISLLHRATLISDLVPNGLTILRCETIEPGGPHGVTLGHIRNGSSFDVRSYFYGSILDHSGPWLNAMHHTGMLFYDAFHGLVTKRSMTMRGELHQTMILGLRHREDADRAFDWLAREFVEPARLIADSREWKRFYRTVGKDEPCPGLTFPCTVRELVDYVGARVAA
ncbi:hypothetical protein RM190_00520 [Paracoccus sp. CPCC 101403]|uniref:Uncharacterized protein n=1 Tax=Paracoccus broussonetiae TaxID=3075834 RepID=A0ABU3E7X0_9RHOB|nr:hypothetical protein [Paracoccus sp. CPCC 101403]MDT1060316.1 hypothetical protein [Paracoccus sp. CPCC 101403]